jgi:cell division GTPase FtsZ
MIGVIGIGNSGARIVKELAAQKQLDGISVFAAINTSLITLFSDNLMCHPLKYNKRDIKNLIRGIKLLFIVFPTIGIENLTNVINDLTALAQSEGIITINLINELALEIVESNLDTPLIISSNDYSEAVLIAITTIADLINSKSKIKISLGDIVKVMKDAGRGYVVLGEGDNANDAAKRAMSVLAHAGIEISKVKGMIVSISSCENEALANVRGVMQTVIPSIGVQTDVFYGHVPVSNKGVKVGLYLTE